MQQGAYTVGDGMRRHLIALERERKNIESSIRLCAGLTDRQERLEDLDAQVLLEEMARMEREGTTFMNKQKQDTKRRRYVAPVVAAILMGGPDGGLIWLFLWAFAVARRGAAAAGAGPVGGHPRGGGGGRDHRPGPADSGDRTRGGGRCETVLNRPGSGGHPLRRCGISFWN